MLNVLNKSLFPKAVSRALALGVAVVALSSCYLPVRFDSEIEINREGYYSMIFDGYLADIGLYRDIKDKKLSQAEQKDRIAVIKRDFERDTSTKQFEYFHDGVFHVNWENKGDLLKAKTVTFVRRNELILQLKYVQDTGYIVLEGKSLKDENRKRVLKEGLNMQGEIRVKTDLPIKSDNATYKKKDPHDARFQWLVWNIKSIMDPRPRAIFIIE